MKPVDSPRALMILARILALSEEQIGLLLEDVLREFGDRHQRVSEIFHQRFLQVQRHLPAYLPVSEERRLLHAGKALCVQGGSFQSMHHPSSGPVER